MTAFDDDRRELERRYAEFRQEIREPGTNFGGYKSEQLSNVLDRLSFWSGLFTGLSAQAHVHEGAGDYSFPLRLAQIMHEIDQFTIQYSRAYHSPPAQAPAAPPAQSAAPVKKKLTPKQEADLYVRRKQIEIATNQRKFTDLMILKHEANVSPVPIVVEDDPGAEYCGLIHLHCGYNEHGRCKKKIAHGACGTDYFHVCSRCGSTFL